MEEKKVLNNEELEKVTGGQSTGPFSKELKEFFNEAKDFFAGQVNVYHVSQPRVATKFLRMIRLCDKVNTDDDVSIRTTLNDLHNIADNEIPYPENIYAKNRVEELEFRINARLGNM